MKLKKTAQKEEKHPKLKYYENLSKSLKDKQRQSEYEKEYCQPDVRGQEMSEFSARKQKAKDDKYNSKKKYKDTLLRSAKKDRLAKSVVKQDEKETTLGGSVKPPKAPKNYKRISTEYRHAFDEGNIKSGVVALSDLESKAINENPKKQEKLNKSHGFNRLAHRDSTEYRHNYDKIDQVPATLCERETHCHGHPVPPRIYARDKLYEDMDAYAHDEKIREDMNRNLRFKDKMGSG